MNHIRVFHGSYKPKHSLSENKITYTTPSLNYGYIKKMPHIQTGIASPITPYYTDKTSMVESLRSFPEKVQVLKLMGYDSVVYAKPDNFLKGASGWGDDAPQIIILNPDIMTKWEPIEQNLLHTLNQPYKPKHMIGPFFHSTNEAFLSFEESADIGFHFGTLQAATDRTHPDTNNVDINIEVESKSNTDLQRLKYHSITQAENTKTILLQMLYRKLTYPKPDLELQVHSMNEDEVISLIDEFQSKPDYSRYTESLERAQKEDKYNVNIGNNTFAQVLSLNDAENIKSSIPGLLMKKSYLSVNNPLRMQDLGTWSAQSILAHTPNTTVHEHKLHLAESNEAAFEIVRKAIIGQGYDSIVYENAVEDPGSDSYIVFNRAQILDVGPKITTIESKPTPTNSASLKR
jgi:hypothetical protein